MGLRNGLQLLLQFLGACFPMFSTAGQITNRYTQLPNLLLFLAQRCFHRSRLARSFLILRAAFLSSFITPPRHENLSSVGSESSMKYNVRKTHGLDSLAQRSLNTSKLHAIKRFLRDPDNTIPTSIIISLNLPAEARIMEGGQFRKIRFTYDQADPKFAVVIDGQHRLLGMKDLDPSLHVNVVALLTGDLNEAAFQFLVINNKASKVPTDHIKTLLAERQDTRLQERLLTARLSIDNRYEFVATADNDPESPFRNEIDWPTNRTGVHLVKPAGIETAVRDIQSARSRSSRTRTP